MYFVYKMKIIWGFPIGTQVTEGGVVGVGDILPQILYMDWYFKGTNEVNEVQL